MIDYDDADFYGRTGEKAECYCCEGRGTYWNETCFVCVGYGWVRQDARAAIRGIDAGGEGQAEPSG